MRYTRNIDAPLRMDGFTLNSRAGPQYPDIGFMDNGAAHDYYALNIEAQRHLFEGVSLQTTCRLARETSGPSGN